MLKQIIDPMSEEEFFAKYWGRQFLHLPGPARRFSHLFPWERLNRALEENWFDAKRLVLFKAGNRIPEDRYLNGNQVHSDKLTIELSNGATLIFNHCDDVHPPLRDLCIDLERLFHHRVQVNLYAGWRQDNGFKVHWDDQNTIILQVAGRKRWKIWTPDRLHPFRNDLVDTNQPPEKEPYWDQTLEPGGLLAIPRGWWHIAYPLDEPCLHLTVTVKNRTGVDLLRWLADEMKSSETTRMDLPAMAASEERADWLERFRLDLLAACDCSILDRYFAAQDAKSIPRPQLSLPQQADPRSNKLHASTRLELAVPALHFQNEQGKICCLCGGIKLQVDTQMAAKLARFNDRRPHTIGEIVDKRDIRATGLLGIMVMTGVLRRAS